MGNLQCQVCNNDSNNRSYIAKEMLLGLREQFKYFQCSQCGCLQISEIPSDMRPYYPFDNYYSFLSPQQNNSFKYRIDTLLRKKIVNLHLGKFSILGYLSVQFDRYKNELTWIKQLTGLKRTSAILDVGCGAGSLLLELNRVGFSKLTGLDPFIDKDINYKCGVHIWKKYIYELKEQYDLVMLNHSFEHMDNPNGTFEQFSKLIKPDGRLLIRIPVVDSYSWRKYGISWYQLDAPRHFFLHTIRSMTILAKNHGFEMLSVKYDSNENQFYYSEKYIRDKSFSDKVFFKSTLINQWKKHAEWLNSINDGDQACFIFSRTLGN